MTPVMGLPFERAGLRRPGDVQAVRPGLIASDGRQARSCVFERRVKRGEASHLLRQGGGVVVHLLRQGGDVVVQAVGLCRVFACSGRWFCVT